MMRKMLALGTALFIALGTIVSAVSADEAVVLEKATVTVFAAKSLNGVVDELIRQYKEIQPNVEVLGSYDSSGTLMTQIKEGASCDIFFSAAQKQMNSLEEEGFVVEGTRKNLVNNQVCVVKAKGTETKVTGLETLKDASSIALADGSVPVGNYTRIAMVNLGLIEKTDDPSALTTSEISEALGGVEINECANVGACAAAVSEGSNEVGTVYYSDTYGYGDSLEVIEFVPYELTGNVIYPAARIINPEADDAESAAADDFAAFLSSDQAKEVFESYRFDTNVD